MRSHAVVAEQAGPDPILVACAILSPLVDEVRLSVGITIVIIDAGYI